MKQVLVGITLCAATAALAIFYPVPDSRALTTATQPVRPAPALTQPVRQARIEVVFALDTTGSMSGLLEAAKDKVWSIATSMGQAEPAPEIRIGLVAFRDRGDDYVTQWIDLSTDLDSMYARLMQFQAAGGGDTPEAVNQALADAVERFSWTADPAVYKAIFLIGDAPPHEDYQDEAPYPAILERARERGIVVNTVQCGNLPGTQDTFTRIAALAQGSFFQVAQDGAAVAVSTPYDAELARLSAAIDDTRVFFGDAAALRKLEAKRAATASLHAAASPATRARRATFNASASGAANFAGEHELVAAVRSGAVDLDSLGADSLPAPIAAMAPAERVAHVEAQAAKRDELEREIATLAEQRADYIAAALDKAGGAHDSLDEQIFATVRAQATAKGLRYSGSARH